MGSISFGLWVFAVCFAMAGVQFVYSIQFALGVPFFSQRFKLPNSVISVILGTAGPISGFIVQPIVGVYSDHCTSKFGRRRPFILGGSIGSVIGMLVISNSVILGQLMGDETSSPDPHKHIAGVTLAIVGLWIINLAANVMQGPGRALIADIIPPESQNLGNAMVVNTMAMANIIANVVGAQFLETSDPYRYLFFIGAAFTGLACIPTLIVAREIPYSPEKKESISPVAVFKKIGIAFSTMPSSVLRIAIVFFFSWCAYTPFMVFGTSYFAINVFHGDPNSDDSNYQQGVKWGMYSLAISAAVSFIFSVIIPFVLRLIGVKITYFFSQMISAVALVMLLYTSEAHKLTLVIAIALSAAISINFTTFNSVPFAMLAETVQNSEAGLYMGVLNSASVVSQTITGIIAGQIVGFKHQDVAWGIGFGGILSLLAGLLVPILPLPKKRESVEETVPLIQ